MWQPVYNPWQPRHQAHTRACGSHRHARRAWISNRASQSCTRLMRQNQTRTAHDGPCVPKTLSRNTVLLVKTCRARCARVRTKKRMTTVEHQDSIAHASAIAQERMRDMRMRGFNRSPGCNKSPGSRGPERLALALGLEARAHQRHGTASLVLSKSLALNLQHNRTRGDEKRERASAGGRRLTRTPSRGK